MKKLLLLFLCLFVISGLWAQDPVGSHFYFSGPLNGLTAPGVKIAPVSSGLPFTIELTENGTKITPSQFDLKPPGSAAALTLQLAGVKFANGHLTGTAKIVNSTGTVLEGVRLDIVSASESYQTKDPKGTPVTSIRTRAIDPVSPLLFGDLAKNESSDALAFDTGTLKFTPETTKIVVNGLISGLRYLGAFNVPDVNNPRQIDTDRQGRLYICDTPGDRVLRTDAEGRNPETVARLEDQCLSSAVNPKTGDIYAVRGNADVVYVFSASGAAKGSFPGGDYVGLESLRFDHAGNLYTSGSHVFRFQGQKAALDVKQALDEELSARGIDVDVAGNIWVVSGLEDKRSVFRISPDGKSALRISNGLDWHLGAADVPQTVRIDSAGNAYVAELGVEGSEASRISVFDNNGRFVRVFGRGGRTPDPNADKLLVGQTYRPTDIAFGPDGRVYIAGENDGGFKENLMLMFMPF